MSLILATDLTSRLSRLNNELTRRNGYTTLAASTVSFPVGEPVTIGEKAMVSAINTILTGLRYVNTAGVPSDRVSMTSEMLAADLTTIDNILTTYEAQPRGATTGNDCASACCGMCVTQCTTGCTGCTGSCTSCSGCTGCSGCWTSCSNCYTSCTSCTGCINSCAIGCAYNCAVSSGAV